MATITIFQPVRKLLLLVVAALSMIPSAIADEKATARKELDVWGGVVYATNGTPKAGYNNVTAKLNQQLSKIAPNYKTFQLLGDRTEPVLTAYESWVVPTREFFYKVDYKGKTSAGHTMLGLQVWHEKKVLVKTDANVKPGNPIVIQGPKWGEGQVIFVINLK